MKPLFDKTVSEIFGRYPDYELIPSNQSRDGKGEELSFVIHCERPKGVQISYFTNWILEVYVLPELILDQNNHWSKYHRFSSRNRHFQQTGGNAFKIVRDLKTGVTTGQDLLCKEGREAKPVDDREVIEMILQALDR